MRTRSSPASSSVSSSECAMTVNKGIIENFRHIPSFFAFSMSCLHVWFSRLKWHLDVLLRFYARHSLMCALHKETRLLFDEFIFCLQRLFAVEFAVDLNSVSAAGCSHHYLPGYYEEESLSRAQSGGRSHSCCTSCQQLSIEDDENSTRTSSASSRRSRIPRPISLPKRLEFKLGTSPSPVGRTQQSHPKKPLARAKSGEARALSQNQSQQQPPTKPPLTSRKSRVRETIRLFDTKTSPGRRRQQPQSTGRPPLMPRPPISGAMKRPQTASAAVVTASAIAGGRPRDTGGATKSP